MTDQQYPTPEETPAPSTQAQGPSTAMLIFGLTTLFVVIAAAAFTLASVANLRSSERDDSAEDALPAVISAEDQSDGVTEVEPRPLENFTLINQAGETVRLSDFEGKYVLLYFGFTYCPDFCPTTLLDFRNLKRQLGEDADQIEFAMISVDIARDTPEVLNRYISRFDPAFIGLTAEDSAAIDAVAEDFNVFYQINDTRDSPYYTVDHTASKFLIDPQGRLTTVYAFRTPVEVMAENLRQKLS